MARRRGSRGPDATQDMRAVGDDPRPLGPTEAPDERAALRTRRRFARRQWSRRWLAWRPLVLVLALVALVGVAVWLVFFSSYFAVQAVRVTGLQHLRPSQVERAAAVPTGEPLARADLARIRSRVQAMEEVRSADVTRQWPDTVRIDVVERQPVAVVDLGGQLRGLDEDGVVFRDFPRAPAGLPRLETAATTGSEALREGARVAAALPASLASQVDHVTVETVDAITLELRDGREVAWGSAEESGQKAAVLADLLSAVKAKHYDVSVPGQPTTRD